MKNILKKIIRFGYFSKQETNSRLNIIRDIEWDAIKEFIRNGSTFLDVGCGTGYSMKKAINDFNCKTFGIDPQPMLAGVKTDIIEDENFKILKGVGENLPFGDNIFDIVFTSHVLEHVDDTSRVLQEIRRVLKSDGILILGVPTESLAWISFFSQLIYTTHIRIARYIASFFIAVRKTKFIHIFIPYSHSDTNKTVLSDIMNYRVKNWRNLINKYFHINSELLPALYGFAEFKIPLKIRKYGKYSSSVFFICKKL